MRITHLPLIVVGVGVFLIVLSLMWPRTFGKPVWSEEQASEHADAAAKLHRLAHEQAHGADHAHENHPEHGPESLQEAKQRYEHSSAMLEEARSRPRRIAKVLKWTGVLCSLLGGGAHFLLLRWARG